MSSSGGIAVCAVTPDASAVAAQSRPPDRTVVAEPGGAGPRTAILAAATTGADWLWVLGEGVDPDRDALAELLAPLGDLPALGDPVLFSSKVVGPDGRMDPDALPWPRLLARELAMAGADHRLAALRAARAGSLLVERRAVERHGPPRADFAATGGDLEWTGRLLRDDPGYVVPRSLAVRRSAGGAAPDVSTFTRERVRILRGDGWRGQEKAWFAFLLAQDLVQRGAARPAGAGRLARAVVQGLRAPA